MNIRTYSTAAIFMLRYVYLVFLINHWTISEAAAKTSDQQTKGNGTNYLLYSVNPGEGFNLRRDVHMRAATLVKELSEKDDGHWVLVLPPWPHLYHWKTRDPSMRSQDNVKWEEFFDLTSLNEYVPSIEFDEYLTREGKSIDEVIYLQNFAEGWGADGWKEKMEDRPCIDPPRYRQIPSKGQPKEEQWTGYIFGYKYGDIVVRSFRCVSIMGYAKTLLPELQNLRENGIRSIMVERFETVMHSRFGGTEYWMSRASMVFAQHLREVGNRFMRDQLGYDPGSGNGRRRPRNGGGEFISVHLRREDYKRAKPDKVPSLEGAAAQINTLKAEQRLSKVFLASDAPKQEKTKLAKMVDGLIWYNPTKDELHRYGDGGVAIIDQWIASHAKYFTGTIESTFSFRIREERQFMDFSRESTYNQLCGSNTDESDPHSCGQPSYWKVEDQVIKNLQFQIHEEL